MGDFFKGWRRKLGLMTPMMACLFMGAWFKTFTHFYKLSCATGKMSYCEISSVEGSIKADFFYNNDPKLSHRRFVFQNFGDFKLKGWADVLWFALERPRDDDVFPDYERGPGGFRFKIRDGSATLRLSNSRRRNCNAVFDCCDSLQSHVYGPLLQ